MFRRIAGGNVNKARQLFLLHPIELNALLELAWENRVHDLSQDLGHPDRRSDLPELPAHVLRLVEDPEDSSNAFVTRNRQLFGARPTGEPPTLGRVRWDHLVYALLVENTRIYEIFRKVVHEFLHGENLGTPTIHAQHWLRNTEEIFFSKPTPFFVNNTFSDLRSDGRAVRRNAYWRMFGMDLNHGDPAGTNGAANGSANGAAGGSVGAGPGGQPYPYARAENSNTDFVEVFEEFLREVWVGIANLNNTSGTNPTDDAAIADLAEKLHDMLRARRENGNLAREEFWAVSAMSWFHLTVEFDSPIVETLRAEASSEEQRLRKVADRVNMPAHKMAKSFLDLADPMSRLLTLIETGALNEAAAAPALFQETPLQDDVRTIITHWSIATGRNLKSPKREGVSA